MEDTATEPHMTVSALGADWKFKFMDFLITFAGVFLAIEVSKVI